MPLYLVRESYTPGPMTVAAADVVTEFEVEAVSLRSAATRVMDRKPGDRSPSMTVRTSREPYTNAYIEPEAGRYAGVADIAAGKRSTLPKAPPLHGVLEVTKAIFARNAEMAGIDDEGDPSIAMYHVLHSVMGFAASTSVSLRKVVHDIHADYEAITGEEPPALMVPGSLPAGYGSDAEIGKALVALNAYDLGLDTDDDPEIGLFHLMVTLINYADHAGVDLQRILDQAIPDGFDSAPAMKA